MSTDNCILCKVDATGCDERTYRSLYYVIGRNAPPEAHICEEHILDHAFALPMLSMLTGHGEWADKLREALNAPKLRLVPSEATSEDPKR
jgi:hypothetical protein